MSRATMAEMLADMLLLGGISRGARTISAVTFDPNRFNALLGAGKAAEKLGRNRLAASYYRTLVANCLHADGAATDELQHARAIVAGQ